MHIFGKILGTFFGFLFGGWFGALLCLFLGNQFDKARAYRTGLGGGFSSGPSQSARQAEFFNAAFAVMGHVAKAKGQVTEQEIHLANTIMARMNLNSEQKRAAQEAFRQGKQADFPLDEILSNVQSSSAGRSDLLQFFLEIQISAAFADGDLDPNERSVLHKIAQGLGFSAEQLESRLRMQEAAFRFQQGGAFGGGQQRGSSGQWQQPQAQANRLADAYKVLGIDEGTSDRDVKKAYRKLMNEHHPDKLMAKGLPPEMMNMAKEKSQEIQQAYELIKKEKGFK
jgi:DnaJ like chaperone protein